MIKNETQGHAAGMLREKGPGLLPGPFLFLGR